MTEVKSASEVQRDERVNMDRLGVCTVFDTRTQRGLIVWTLIDEAGRYHYSEVHPACEFRTL
jgi:hypothetical protein